MKLILLLAGEGTRLRPYTNNRPKCLVEIKKRSILDRQLKTFQKANIKDVVFVTGYCHEKLDKYNVRTYYNGLYDKSNMVYSLYQAIEELDSKKSSEIIISYGDILFSPLVLQKLIDSEEDISVVADKKWYSYWRNRMDNVLNDAESFKTFLDGSIKEIGQSIGKIEEVEAQYIGLLKFKNKGIKILRKELESIDFTQNKNINMYLTDFIQGLINEGYRVSPIYIERDWYEVDTVFDKQFVEEQHDKWL